MIASFITSGKTCVPINPTTSSLQLTGKILLLDFDNMFARYDNESEVTVDQLHLDRRLSGGFTLSGGLCALRGGGLTIFVGVL